MTEGTPRRKLSVMVRRARSILMWKCVRVAKLSAVRLVMLPAAALTLVFGSFAPQAQAQFRDVIVFAAASLREALADANGLFLFENGSGVVVTYGASLALAKQIENGAPADVFIPADSGSMDYLAERKLIMPDTRENFLLNKLVLVAGAA